MAASRSIAIFRLLQLLLLCCFSTGSSRRVPPTAVDSARQEFLRFESSLWSNIEGRPDPPSQWTIVTEFWQFAEEHLKSSWDEHKYAIINFHEWELLVRKLMQTEILFERFRNLLDDLVSVIVDDGEQRINDDFKKKLLDITKSILRNDSSFSLNDQFNFIELVMVKQALFYRALLVSFGVKYASPKMFLGRRNDSILY